MYTLYFFLGVFFFIIIIDFIIEKNYDLSFVDTCEKIAPNILGIWLLCCVAWFFTDVISGKYLDSKIISKIPVKEKIYSLDLKNNNSINGIFVLGIGSISSSNHFEYIMYKDAEGGKKIFRTSEYETIIYEDENVNPYMVRKCYVYYDTSRKKHWSLLYCKNYEIKSDGTIRLHIPQNTIKTQYNVNLDDIK